MRAQRRSPADRHTRCALCARVAMTRGGLGRVQQLQANPNQRGGTCQWQREACHRPHQRGAPCEWAWKRCDAAAGEGQHGRLPPPARVTRTRTLLQDRRWSQMRLLGPANHPFQIAAQRRHAPQAQPHAVRVAALASLRTSSWCAKIRRHPRAGARPRLAHCYWPLPQRGAVARSQQAL